MKLANSLFAVFVSFVLLIGTSTRDFALAKATTVRGIEPTATELTPDQTSSIDIHDAIHSTKAHRTLAIRIELCAIKSSIEYSRADYHTIWRYPEYANNLTLNKKAVRGNCGTASVCSAVCRMHSDISYGDYTVRASSACICDYLPPRTV